MGKFAEVRENRIAEPLAEPLSKVVVENSYNLQSARLLYVTVAPQDRKAEINAAYDQAVKGPNPIRDVGLIAGKVVPYATEPLQVAQLYSLFRAASDNKKLTPDQFNNIVQADSMSKVNRAIEAIGYKPQDILSGAMEFVKSMVGEWAALKMHSQLYTFQMNLIVREMGKAVQAEYREERDEKEKEEQLGKLKSFEAFVEGGLKMLKEQKTPESDAIGIMLADSYGFLGKNIESILRKYALEEDLKTAIMMGTGPGNLGAMNIAFQY